MAAGDYRIGLDGKFHYGASGSQASTEADNVRNVNLNMSKRMAEAVRRGKSWVAKKPVITEGTVEFEIYDIEGDAFLTAVRAGAMPTSGAEEAYQVQRIIDAAYRSAEEGCAVEVDGRGQ